MSKTFDCEAALLDIISSIPDDILLDRRKWADPDETSYPTDESKLVVILLAFLFKRYCDERLDAGEWDINQLPPEALAVCDKLAGLANVMLAIEIKWERMPPLTADDIIDYLLVDGLIPCPFSGDETFDDEPPSDSFPEVGVVALLFKMFEGIRCEYNSGKSSRSDDGKLKSTPYGGGQAAISMAAQEWAVDYQAQVKYVLELERLGRSNNLWRNLVVYDNPELFSSFINKKHSIDGGNHLNIEL